MEPNFAALEDEELVRLAHDDHDAFEALYRRYVTSIYRYCYARTNNVADAEDLTAQTFLAMVESIERDGRVQNFPAWLFGIARHKCADHHRAAYAARQQSLADVDPADPEPENVEERLFRNSVLECVEGLLMQLSPDRIEALRLRYWGGLRIQEVAKVMRRSEAAVKMLISRAISELRERCETL